ncbi:LPS assembly protein LptD [Bowmanella denitrificans]|uniref:LPS-assembly protein LptD n=1 Tax=Bowmanella denitrificans TaxID=366582 RepID=A0ABP3H969_9ALTE
MRLKRLPLAIFWLLSTSATAQQMECPIPERQILPDAPVTNPGDIHVKAGRTEIQQDNLALFSGNVEINSEQGLIQAQRARIDKTQRALHADGNIRFADQQIQVNSDQIDINLASGKLRLENTEYQMLGFQGRGLADSIQLDSQQGLELQEVSFSTCPAGAEDWLIKASSLQLSPDDNWGTARNTRFYLGGVPVFYLPYFKFPVTDQRQTGLLFPRVSTSDKVGVSYEQPFYWNIAPNYDATISPRIMTDRGVQLKTEFRYLTAAHSGQLDLEYLADDRRYEPDDARYFYRFMHQGKLSENWQISAQVNGLSDDNYIVDLGSDYYNRGDTHLYQTLAVNYFSDPLDFSAEIRDFEVIGDHPSAYRAVPELKLHYRQALSDYLNFRLRSELARFEDGRSDTPSASRLHLMPTLSLPLQNAWGELLTEASVLQTWYRQDLPDGSALSENVSRTLGQGRIYGAINFEKQTELFGDSMTQTLEPKFQYLYTSYENQDAIGLYDSNRLLNDYTGLFRGQEFVGLDRISDSNHLTLGVTTRLLDARNKELFKLSLGQIFYFNTTRLTEYRREDDRSALAAELDWRLSSKWMARSAIQLSASNQKVERSNLTLDYRLSEDKLLQISHRYVRDISGEEINQLGLTASWPLAQNWHWVGRWYKDLHSKRTIESFTGIQYESCCWAIQVGSMRYLSNRFDALGGQSTEEFDTSIMLEFVFKGVGSKKSSRTMLDEGLFGYRQPYFLHN